MRILCMADDVPWPQKSGYKIRLANVVQALSELGELDLFVRVPYDLEGVPTVPTEAGIVRSRLVRADAPRSTPAMFTRWATTRLPRTLARADWTGARRELESFAQLPYDAVWFGHADTFVELGDLVDGPGVVDLDNLEDQRIQHLRLARSIDRSHGRRDHVRSLPRSVAARAFDRFDGKRWAALQRRITEHVAAVTVCSELDRARLNRANVAVLPNGYELPEPVPVPRRVDPVRPVFGMVGLLTYEPNSDGAWFFADEIFPAIRREVPGARFRLIGRYDRAITPLGERSGVELAGEVPDIGAELADVDVIVVPLRFGAGTRIKVLEAFARRIPVVSTTVGFEGIAAEDGVHLLVADDAPTFAQKCLVAARDSTRRDAMLAAAHGLWKRQFRWSDIRPLVRDLVQSVADGAAPHGR